MPNHSTRKAGTPWNASGQKDSLGNTNFLADFTNICAYFKTPGIDKCEYGCNAYYVKPKRPGLVHFHGIDLMNSGDYFCAGCGHIQAHNPADLADYMLLPAVPKQATYYKFAVASWEQEDVSPKRCTCDLRSVLMISGCKCGGI